MPASSLICYGFAVMHAGYGMPFALSGCAIVSGDVVESLNGILKDILLTAPSRGGGKGTPEEQLIELLFQAMSCGFL